jgi:ceramide glucosyltransferase
VNPLSLALVAWGWTLFAAAAASIAYTVMAGVFVHRFFAAASPIVSSPLGPEGVSLLKPLHGDEPDLARNLRSCLEQGRVSDRSGDLPGDLPGDLQVVFGLADPADPARAVAEALIAAHPQLDARLCIDGRRHGRNAKVSNLINMAPLADRPILILSDSDIGVTPDYVARVRRALAVEGVGVVTCPYFGVAAAGFWSKFAALGIDGQFMPNVLAGVRLGLANPCMGSTIALRRETLERIGGFEAFRDLLADDYAIGAAVRALGLKSVLAPVFVSHSCVEQSLGEVMAHELRWARTIKGVDSAGHLGSVLTHPLPLAVLAALCFAAAPPSLVLVLAAFIARVWLLRTVDRAIGRPLDAWWLLPLRDMLSFVVFVGSFFGRSVEWRGTRFHVTDSGDLKPV